MTAIEHTSGKNRHGENFPVGSWLIRADLRPHVHRFYRFARTADDIADAADLPSAEKLRRLDALAAVLDGAAGGEDVPVAAAMRQTLRATGLASTHCHQLLDAFRQDAVKSRYADWGELMAYCRMSAAPVGRFLLDLHGESQEGWAASDALCAALQVINHLQDCADDFRTLDRVYLPQEWLAIEGVTVAALSEPRCELGLRRVLNRTINATRPLVALARELPLCVGEAGLRAETSVIVALAERLLGQLAKRDPLAERVALGPVGILTAVTAGYFRSISRGRA